MRLAASSPPAAVARAARAGAAWVVSGGRMEDELALARAAAAAGLSAALVVCGVAAVVDAVGDAVVGWLGPVQWDGERAPPAGAPARGGGLPGGPGAGRGPRRASGPSRSPGRPIPTPLWDAARALRTTTFLGPFAVDAQGRQTAHAPAIVRWEAAPGGPRRRVVWRPPAPEA